MCLADLGTTNLVSRIEDDVAFSFESDLLGIEDR